MAIVNNKVHVRDNYKEPTDGKFDDCTSEILKNLVAEPFDSESDAVEGNWWTKLSKKTPKHEAETCWNNSKTTVWISLLIYIIQY